MQRNNLAKMTWLEAAKKKFNLTDNDVISIAVCIICACYFLITQPLTSLVFTFAAIATVSARVIVRSIPVLERIIGARIKTWHIASIISACTVLFGGILHLPAEAAMFQAIEDSVTEVLSESGIDSGIVEAIFTVFRIIVIFAFLAGGVALATQALQGGNWQPLASLMGIGIGFVITIEILTRLVLETGGGGAAP